MKVLLVSETLVAGGAETFVVRLANALSAHCTVKLVVLHKELIDQQIAAQLNNNVELITIDVPAKKIVSKAESGFLKLGIDYAPLHEATAKQLKKVIKNFLPNIVNTHLFKTDFLVDSIRRSGLKNFKHVATIHGDYSAYYYGTTDARMKNIPDKIDRVIKGIDDIVCICDEHLQFFEKEFPAALTKTHKIYNGFLPASNEYLSKTKESLGLPVDKFLFVMVSRGVELKGWKKAVEAFKKLDSNNAALVLVGKGEYLDKMAETEKDPAIIFAGFTSNPVEYIQHADACLLPTLFPYESLPTVVMEYLYCGKPVIATNVGEIPRMIDAGDGKRAGILLGFDGNTVQEDELAEAMRQVWKDAELKKELASNTAAAFKKFDMQHCTGAYLKLYKAG